MNELSVKQGCDRSPKYQPGEIITINPHMTSSEKSKSFLVLRNTPDNRGVVTLKISFFGYNDRYPLLYP